MPSGTGTVLIAYDGSDDAARAITTAATLLSPRRAVVAYVWDSLASLLLHTDVDRLTGQMKEAAEELDASDLEDARARALEGATLAREPGRDADAIAAKGKPKAWPTLLELAREYDASVIVIGSRGLGAVKSAVLGSVSSGVLHHAHRPVLVVPPPEDGDTDGPVIVAYDGSEDARRAIQAVGKLMPGREVLVRAVWVS